MIKNVKTSFNRKPKYIIGGLLVLSLFSVVYYNYTKKEPLYLLYDDYSNCHNVKDYEKEMYFGMCYEYEVIFFKIKTENKAYKIKNTDKIKFTSKQDFFTIDYRKFKDYNIILIIKHDNGYDVIPVKPFEIIS